MKPVKSGKKIKAQQLFSALLATAFITAFGIGGCQNFTPSAASNPATNNSLPVPPLSSLGPTKIAFTAVCTNGSNSFTFDVLQTLSAGETVYFTDKGWNAPVSAFTSASVMTFVPSKTLPPGTQVFYAEPASGSSTPASLVYNSSVTGTCGTFNSTFGMSKFDWECIAYEVPSTGVTHFMTAVNMNSSSPWLTGNMGTPAKGYSYLPPGLTFQNSVDLYFLQAENTVYDDCEDIQFPYEISAEQALAKMVYKNNWMVSPGGGSSVALPGTGVSLCDFTAVITP
jgi:hypothetical protein